MTKKRIFFETEEIIKKTRRGYIDLDTDYFQFYSIAFKYIASLTSVCAKDFILWIMSKVDDENEFTFNNGIHNEFLDDLSKIPNPKTYTSATVFVALKELTDKQILMKMAKGKYKVNPRLFWSKEISKRITTIRNLESNKIVVPETEQEVPDLNETERHEPEDAIIEPHVIGSPDK